MAQDIQCARIIPAIRTPRGVDVFDYEIPEGMEIMAGDAVRIPFRSKTIVGIVESIGREKNTRPLKKISERYAGVRLSETTLRLIRSLAERSFSSRASVLHAWFGVLPKRNTSNKTPSIKKRNPFLNNEAVLMSGHVFGSGGVVESAKRLSALGHAVCVICPRTARAQTVADALKTVALTSELAQGARFRLWSAFVRGESNLIVTTRVGAWCAAESDAIILDEPESDDHKQDELSPRFDARWVCAFLNACGIGLLRIGLTPRLAPPANAMPGETGASPVPPDLSVKIQAVDVHRADWSPIAGIQNRTLIAMEEARDDGRPITIIHPVHGEQARLRCVDCQWEASCERCGAGLTVERGAMTCKRCRFKTNLSIACPVCGCTNLSKSRPGRERLASDCHAQGFPNAQILSIGEWNTLDRLPDHSLVVCTDLHLMAGGGEDLRKKERLIVVWRSFADLCEGSGSSIVVQGDPSLLAQAKSWLSSDGCLSALRAELEERRRFGLPPSVRMIKLIFRGNQGHAIRMLDLVKSRASRPDISIQGPFPVPFRPSHRDQRWTGHICAPLDLPLETAYDILDPLLKTDTIIDLDPIAFFE